MQKSIYVTLNNEDIYIMINEFVVVLKDSRYITITTESEQLLTEDEKMDFVLTEFDKSKIDSTLIDYLSNIESVKVNSSLEPVVWLNNEFLIFLKDESYISIETTSLNTMTLENKMAFAVEHLKSTGVNTDKISHIGDKEELQSKTNAMLFSWVITGAVIVSIFMFIF